MTLNTSHDVLAAATVHENWYLVPLASSGSVMDDVMHCINSYLVSLFVMIDITQNCNAAGYLF